MKNIKGITLISLVITIIVIIILCIVATNYLFGNEGVLNNAKVATESYNKAMEKEAIDKVFEELKIKRDVNESIDEITAKLIEDGLIKRGYNVSVENEDENFLVTFLNTGDIFVVDGDGTLVEERKTDPIEVVPMPPYTVAYMPNGGSGTMESNTGDIVSIAENAFTAPSGKIFKEWNTKSDGKGTSYTAGTTVDRNLTLFAIWKSMVGTQLNSYVSVGDYIIYNPTLGVTNSSVLSYTSPVGDLKIKNGNNEYVVYETGVDTDTYLIDAGVHTYDEAYKLLNQNGEFVTTGYTVESDVSGNGYDTQSFTATASNSLWRVLDVNTTTGVIKIIPEEPIKTTTNTYFYLNRLRGYKNGITELNNISEIFGHGQGASGAASITIEQIDAATGFAPTKEPKLVSAGNIGKWYDTTIPHLYYPTEVDNSVKSMLYKKYASYWMASNFIYNPGGEVYFKVGAFSINAMSSRTMYGVNRYGHNYDDDAPYLSPEKYYTMPVVTLEPDIEYLRGEGTEDSPWVFQDEGYRIEYNANGGSGIMELSTGQMVTVRTNTFTAPTGKIFKEWNTKENGMGRKYTAGTTVTTNLILYAIWTYPVGTPLSICVNVGDYITYNPTLGVTNSNLLNYTSPIGTLKVKDGDTYLVNESGTDKNRFEYNGAYNLINENGEFVTTGYTMESDVPGNGYGEQSFAATESNNSWKVLDVNTTTGVIKIVPYSAIYTTSRKGLFFQGLRGYKNCKAELDNISEIFGHGQGANGAVSITEEDINKLTGYVKESPTLEAVGGSVNKSWYKTSYWYSYFICLRNYDLRNWIFKNYWLATTAVGVNTTEEYNQVRFGLQNMSTLRNR